LIAFDWAVDAAPAASKLFVTHVCVAMSFVAVAIAPFIWSVVE
jgi:hypothetical protein